MQIRVELFVDEDGVEKLRRFWLDGREIDVANNIDQWHGADHRYFKVGDSDSNVYILRLNEARADWELTMYQRTQSPGVPTASMPSAGHFGHHNALSLT